MVKINTVEPSLWAFKGIADYTDRKLLMSTPYPVIFILITYLWFVKKFGPEFMKNRKPYKLYSVLAIYNIAQVIISFYTLYLESRVVSYDKVLQLGWYDPVCYSQIKYEQVADGAYFFFLSKLIELVDTVFFVLRKKQRQVSFLHVYHHTCMVFCTWCTVKYSAFDSMVYIAAINSLVHIVMYSYYGLALFPALKKYLWWKKYITIFQLVQFFLILLNIVLSHFVSSCEKSYMLLSAVAFNTILFCYLFGDFYIKSYMKGRKTSNKSGLSLVINDLSNGNGNKLL